MNKKVINFIKEGPVGIYEGFLKSIPMKTDEVKEDFLGIGLGISVNLNGIVLENVALS